MELSIVSNTVQTIAKTQRTGHYFCLHVGVTES